jgi:uncharacterized protein YdiU (UPF0061 family)
MGNDFDWDDDEDFDFEEPSRDDSNVVKQLRKTLRAKEAELKKFESELSELRGAQRQSTIASVLSSKGVSPKIAKFIPTDIEATTEAIDAWVTEYADVFGIQTQTSQEQAQPDLGTLRQIDSVTANALSPDKEQDLYLRLDQAQSADEIMNMIYGAQE